MRIRTNIEKCLRDLVNPYQSDISTIPDYLHAIIEKGENHVQKARHRLEQALFTFDEAQIFTIHAFCARMLQEYALEGDIHLGMMESDKGLSNSEMLLVIRNFFRSEMRACQYTPEQLSIILRSHSQNIENLENKLLKQLKKGFEIEELNDLTTHLKLFHQAMNHLKSQYSFSKVKILEDFEKQVDLYKKQGDRDEAFSIVEHFAELLEKNEWNSSDLDLLIQDDLYFAKTLDPQHLNS
jgi:exodeoxyribonuclease V beta subunit